MSSRAVPQPCPSTRFPEFIYGKELPAKKPCHSIRGRVSLAGKRGSALPATPLAKPDPLFLFYCGLQWHKSGDPSSGWELVQAMQSGDRGARALAAELFANTENGRLLVRDLRRLRSGLQEIARGSSTQNVENSSHVEVRPMNPAYALQAAENCASCPSKKSGWYCALSSDVMKAFSACSHLTTYPGGAILFVEGQLPRGAIVLCSGRVKLSTTSKEGKVLVLRISEPGEVIGLSALISGERYEITAETMGPCLVNLVEREGLLRLMERSGELGLRSALAVSREFQSAYRDIHDLVLTRSSSGKLARLLLSWAGRDPALSQDLRIHAPVTHEEMAQRIGASRETVTRLLSDLRKKNLIKLEGSTLIIKDRPALEALAV
jgi:CRP/FNR family transcriptional regulator, cyclic AMP receptor protein